MATKHKVAIVAGLLLVGLGLSAASSFTTATLDRDANIDVVADSNGFIGLTDGNSGNIVQISSDELTISFVQGSATGVNVNSLYEIGDPDDPSQRAFNITNNDGVSHDVALNYSVTSGDGVGDAHNHTEFQVFDNAGTQVATASEEGADTFTATSGGSYAVVLVVNTSDDTLTSSSDLSGTLDITAT